MPPLMTHMGHILFQYLVYIEFRNASYSIFLFSTSLAIMKTIIFVVLLLIYR